ncbi:NlpC/P60 family protein [Nonomuraea sp. NBC_01738]|uniref:C40 family peptidase n=1 Tax=Nonomuraea sp. NBC_01738 TaxID=2976003 RepID=UPI002E167A8E|nr:NlpC/P60 family protein [Nonomuraea sp. NBC_01738]
MHSVRAALLVACCLIAVTVAPAHADPGPSSGDVSKAREAVRDKSKELGAASARLAEAQTRLDDLSAAAEQRVETYNGELVRLAQAKAAAELAKTRLVAAEARVGEARAAVAAIAAESYGGLDLSRPIVTMIAGGNYDGDFLQRASVLEQLGGERTLVLDRMRAAEEAAEVLREQSAEAYVEQQAAMERAAEAKTEAERAVAEQNRETKRLLAVKKNLQQEVDAARSEADRLARQRAAALERAQFAGVALASGSGMGDLAANWALTQLGKPYVWAAAGPSSYDCSGLTMRAWERAGVGIDHWTGTQWTSGPHVPLPELRRGDLLFFGRISADPGTIHHVGMYIGRGLMVHAPQTGDVVRIASMWRRDLVGATRPR